MRQFSSTIARAILAAVTLGALGAFYLLAMFMLVFSWLYDMAQVGSQRRLQQQQTDEQTADQLTRRVQRAQTRDWLWCIWRAGSGK